MKTRALIFFSAMIFCFGVTAIAQNNKTTNDNTWMPVLISNDGTNGNNGVEANYKLGKCNSFDVILLKLTNTNDYSVKAEWTNLVQTNDGRDLFGTGVSFINLPPKSETAGDCSGSTTQLVIKLNDYGIYPVGFKAIIGSNFQVTKKSK
jgi:hypothetical protein